MRIAYLLLLLVACKDQLDQPSRATDERSAPKSRTPLTIEWGKRAVGEVQAKLGGGGQLSASIVRGTYKLALRDLPQSSTWKLGDKSGRITKPSETIDIDVDQEIATSSFDALDRVAPHAELELELGDGRSGKTKLPALDLRRAVKQRLEEIAHGPVVFGKEPDDPNKLDAIVYPANNKLIGTAEKVHEVDRVLIVRKRTEETGRKTCGGYTDTGGLPIASMTLVLRETEAVIYDRRSGEVVERKTFAPDTKCPTYVTKRAGERELESGTNHAAVVAWARSHVKADGSRLERRVFAPDSRPR